MVGYWRSKKVWRSEKNCRSEKHPGVQKNAWRSKKRFGVQKTSAAILLLPTLYFYCFLPYLSIYLYPPPRLRESVWGAFIPGSWYLVPGTWCLGVWSRASIQYPVYRILDTVSQIRNTCIPVREGVGGWPGFVGVCRGVSRDFLMTIFLTPSWTSHFSVFGANLAPCWVPTWLHVDSSWLQVGLKLAQLASS